MEKLGLRSIIRFLIKFSGILALSTTLAGIVFLNTNIPEKLFQRYLQLDVSKKIKQKISLENISGNLLNELSLKGFKIINPKDNSRIFDAKEIEFSYNILDMVLSMGSIPNAVKEITIRNGNFYLERDKDGNWKLKDFDSNNENDFLKKSPKFDGKIKLEKFTLHYCDNRGWGKKPLNSAFSEKIESLSGEIQFRKDKPAQIKLSGRLDSTKAPVKLNGNLDIKSLSYDINFSIEKMDVNQWGPYVLPFKGYHLSNKTVSLEGNIRTRPKNKTAHLPFWYELHFKTTASQLKIPYIATPITNLSGITSIYHGTLTNKSLQEEIPHLNSEETKKLYSDLVQSNLISKEGRICSTLPNFKQLPKKWKPYSKPLEKLFENPSERTEFNNVSGKIGSINGNLNGYIQMNRTHYISLKIQNNQGDLTSLESIFPTVSTLKMSGKGKAQFNIEGPLENPKLFGKFQSKQAQITGLTAHDSNVEFEITHNELKLNAPTFVYMNNTWTGNGSIKLDTAFVNLNFQSNTFSAKHIPALANYAEGTAKINVVITGLAPSLNIAINGNSTTTTLFKQSVNHTQITLKTTTNPPYFLKGIVKGKQENQTIGVTGEITKEGQLNLKLTATNYEIHDIFSNQPHSPGLLNGTALFKIKDDVNIQIEANGTNIPFNGKKYDTIKTSAQYEKNIWNIQLFEAENDKEFLSIKGQLDESGPISTHITAKNIQLSQAWLQPYIPEKLKPLSGLFNANLHIKRTKEHSNFEVIGSGTIEQGTIMGQYIQSLTSQFEFANNTLQISKMDIMQDVSKIKLQGTLSAHSINLNILENSQIDLDEFTTLLHPYGNFRGIIQGKAHITGSLIAPKIDATFKSLNFQTALQSFDKVEGHVVYDPPFLKLSPINIESNQNRYTLQGEWNIKQFSQKESKSNHSYMFKLSIEKGNIQTFLSVLDALYSEFKTDKELEKVRPEKITNPNITISAQDEKGNMLLFEQGNPQNVLELFFQKANQKTNTQNHFISRWVNSIKGNLKGELSIIGNPDTIPIINANLGITDFAYKKYKAKALNITITPDKTNTSYVIQAQEGKIGTTPFASIFSSGGINSEGILTISKLEIDSVLFDKQSILEGSFPLSPFWTNEPHKHNINLKLSLIGNQINLLTPLFPNIQDITNEGKLICTITGPLNNPQFNTKESIIKNATLRFSEKHPLFNTPITITSANISIQNNKIKIKHLPLTWEQQNTLTSYIKNNNKYSNKAFITGEIELLNLNILDLEKISLDYNIHMAPTSLVFSTSTFKGKASFENVSFIGLMHIPISSLAQKNQELEIKNKTENGPILRANIAIRDCILTLTQSQAGSGFLTPIELDINTTIEKNVEVHTSLIGQGLVAGISTHFEFDEKESPLKISGTTNHPVINDTLTIKTGTINLFNRSFKLLTNQEKKRYQPPGQTNNSNNSITFTQYHNDVGVTPILNITATAIVDKNLPLTTNITADQTYPYSHVVLTIDGPTDSLKELKFDVFDSTSQQTYSGSLVYKNTYYIPISFNELSANQREAETSQIIELLMPELFIANQSTSEELLSQYGENRINMLVRQEILRPIEKQISNRVGLYDLRIDYNLGGDLFRRNDTTHREVGIDAIQRIVSDQLFLRVRTDIDLESDRQKSQDAVGISEIELTYYLLKNRNMSVNYANIKDPNLKSEYHPKLSLRFSHEF